MGYRDGDKEKEEGALTDDAIGEVLDKDEDEDESPIVPVEEEEKGWE
jgi:hypothetical protein